MSAELRSETAATLLAEEPLSYSVQIRERAGALAAGFKRLRELGMDRDSLAEMASTDPDSLFDRVQAAIAELAALAARSPRH